MTQGPLAGVRVLDLTRLLPGGYATFLMAGLGADVVKVEEPGRGDYIRWTPPLEDGVSAAHAALNRGKRSIALNLKDAAGVELLHRLAARFDVLIESFRPGVLERLGAGWTQLRATNPSLVYCAISGYGQDGPRSQEAGHDINYTGFAGALSLNGEESGPPVVLPLQIGDFAGGGMSAVIAILAALRRRDTEGEGSFCDISMTDGVASWLGVAAAQMLVANETPRRGSMMLSGAYPCYRVYPAADGWLAVGALEPQFWTELCRVLERPDLEHDAFATGARRTEVIAALERVFRSRSRAEWTRALAGRDTCVTPVLDLREMLDDPQLRARGMVYEGPGPGGRASLHVGMPIRVGAPSDPATARPAPGLGEHTGEILEEIGVDDAGWERLADAGVVA